MYKVLLVDDEMLILNGLKNIIDWESIGVTITATALNGEEAIAKFTENPVDIVITDITMPKMDGLKLIKKIKELDNKVRYIILSGYDDFSYAKQAISLGIENYILKPINEEELEATLKNITAKLDTYTNNSLLEEKNLEILKENILNRWVCNNINPYELEEREFLLGLKLNLSYYTSVIIRIDNSTYSLDIIYRAFKYIKKECEKTFQSAVFKDLENNIICVIGSNDLEELGNKCERFFRELLDKLTDMNIIKAFIAIGSVERGYKCLYSSYSEAKKLQSYLLVFGYNKVVSYEYLMRVNKDKNLNNIDIHEFNKVLLNKDINYIHQYIDKTFDELCEADNIRPEDVQNTAIKMVFMINGLSKELNVAGNTDEDLKQLIFQVFKLGTVEDIKSALKNRSSEIIDEIQKATGNISPVISQVLSYINNNYKQEISLKTLSQKFNINPSYLGQIFHKEVGEQFSDYLNKIRNEKAKELLLNTNLKVNDIAASLGYIDTSYFYRKFKEYFGISPNAMRSSKNYKL